MQAIRKLTGKSKRSSDKRRSLEQQQQQQSSSLSVEPIITPAPILSSSPSEPGAIVTEFNESHKDLSSGVHVDQFEKTEVIPSSSFSSTPAVVESSSLRMESFPTESVRSVEVLPVEIIEKPVVIHESIREEQVEEVQPVFRVEREKTEIRQITQPLVDKEIMPVHIEERTLAVEVLPTIIEKTVTVPEIEDHSTRDFESTRRQVVEKAPIVQETEKWRVIEEVQPIIYREIIVPHIIRTSRPSREVIVEAPVFAERVLSGRELSVEERTRWANLFTKETIVREAISTSSSSSLPITTISEPSVIRVVEEVIPSIPIQHREIVEEVVTTTTTTTVAPVVGKTLSRSNLAVSNASGVTAPIVTETHDVKFGPNGEKITRDSFTTVNNAGVLPARAN